jgi:hypothetical protein
MTRIVELLLKRFGIESHPQIVVFDTQRRRFLTLESGELKYIDEAADALVYLKRPPRHLVQQPFQHLLLLDQQHQHLPMELIFHLAASLLMEYVLVVVAVVQLVLVLRVNLVTMQPTVRF